MTISIEQLPDGSMRYTSRIELTEEQKAILDSLTDDERERMMSELSEIIWRSLCDRCNGIMTDWLIHGEFDL